MKRLILRVLAKVNMFDLDFFDEMVADAEAARQRRIEDEARITTDPHDMARWLQEPVGRRPRPQQKGAHRGDHHT